MPFASLVSGIQCRCTPLLFSSFILLCSSWAAEGAFSAVLQGQSRGTTQWIAGNLQNWRELDSVPCRVYLDGGPASNQLISVNFDHYSNRAPGIEDLTAFDASSNVILTSYPALSAPVDQNTWTYTFTVSLTNNQPGYVEFRARLMAG